MSKSTLKKLHKATEAIEQAPSKEKGFSQLQEAFDLFTQEAKQLEAQYARLKYLFGETQSKLEDSNKKLKEKILDFNAITHYLNNILSKISQGIIFINSQKIITTYNQAAQEIIGLFKEQVILQDCDQVFSDDFFGFSLSGALEGKKNLPIVYTRLKNKDKTQKDLEVSTSYVDSSQKEQSGLILLIRDVTQVRQLQFINNQNERLKDLGEMAASVAHEIRNPLGGIEGFASLLHRDLKNNPQQSKMAQHIIDAAQLLNRIVSKILHYSRPIQPQLQLYALDELAEDSKEVLLADSSFPQNTSILIQKSPVPMEVPIDPQLIKSVFLNLFINASDAMPQGGKITVSFMRDSQYVIMTVADEGQGIAKKDLDKIFSPLFTTKEKGHGLGLSECHKIIGLHGGSIDVSSLEDQGSIFVLKFPLQGSTKAINFEKVNTS